MISGHLPAKTSACPLYWDLLTSKVLAIDLRMTPLDSPHIGTPAQHEVAPLAVWDQWVRAVRRAFPHRGASRAVRWCHNSLSKWLRRRRLAHEIVRPKAKRHVVWSGDPGALREEKHGLFSALVTGRYFSPSKTKCLEICQMFQHPEVLGVDSADACIFLKCHI